MALAFARRLALSGRGDSKTSRTSGGSGSSRRPPSERVL
jgi:hypothetical protein